MILEIKMIDDDNNIQYILTSDNEILYESTDYFKILFVKHSILIENFGYANSDNYIMDNSDIDVIISDENSRNNIALKV